VKITPTDKQLMLIEAALSGKYKIIVYGGAIKGAKTYGMFLLALLAQLKYPGIRMVFVRKDMPTIQRNAYPTWDKIHPANVIDDRRRDNVNPRVLFENKSELIFFGENYDSDKDLNRWRGLDVNWFLLDEVNELSEASFYKAIERSGSYVFENSNTPPPLIVATCNPAQNWSKELIYNKWKTNTLPEGWLYIPATIYDNPYLPTEYLEGLKLLPKYQYEVFVNGNWEIQLKTGGEFYKCWEFGRDVQEVKYNPDLPLRITFDWNVRPYVTLNVWQLEGKTATKINEILLPSPRNRTEYACTEFASTYPEHKAGLYVYGDPTGLKEDTRTEKGTNDFTIVLGALRQYHPQLCLFPKSLPPAQRGNFINTCFDKNFDGIKIIHGANCKQSIDEYSNLKEAMDNTKAKSPEKGADGVQYQKYGHISDADDYFLTYVFQAEYQKYISGSLSFTHKTGKNIFKHGY
jgi:hypothetical protein